MIAWKLQISPSNYYGASYLAKLENGEWHIMIECNYSGWIGYNPLTLIDKNLARHLWLVFNGRYEEPTPWPQS